MPTYSGLQQEVAASIIDTPTAVQSLIPTYINRALRDLQIAHNFKIMEAITDVTVTAEATRVLMATPSDFKEFRGRPYQITHDGRISHLGYATSRADVAKWFGTDEGGEAEDSYIDGPPSIILRSEPTDTAGATNLEIWPLSDGASQYSDGEYRIRCPYWKFLPVLSAAGDTNWFTNNADQFLVEQAASYGFFQDHDEERATIWAQRASASKREVIRRSKYEKLGGNETLLPNHDVFGSPINFGDRRL